MSAERQKTAMRDRLPIPWWGIATVALVGIALGLSLANGHTGDAIVIGVLVIPGIALLGTALYLRFRDSPPSGRER